MGVYVRFTEFTVELNNWLNCWHFFRKSVRNILSCKSITCKTITKQIIKKGIPNNSFPCRMASSMHAGCCETFGKLKNTVHNTTTVKTTVNIIYYIHDKITAIWLVNRQKSKWMSGKSKRQKSNMAAKFILC